MLRSVLAVALCGWVLVASTPGYAQVPESAAAAAPVEPAEVQAETAAEASPRAQRAVEALRPRWAPWKVGLVTLGASAVALCTEFSISLREPVCLTQPPWLMSAMALSAVPGALGMGVSGLNHLGYRRATAPLKVRLPITYALLKGAGLATAVGMGTFIVVTGVFLQRGEYEDISALYGGLFGFLTGFPTFLIASGVYSHRAVKARQAWDTAHPPAAQVSAPRFQVTPWVLPSLAGQAPMGGLAVSGAF